MTKILINCYSTDNTKTSQQFLSDASRYAAMFSSAAAFNRSTSSTVFDGTSCSKKKRNCQKLKHDQVTRPQDCKHKHHFEWIILFHTDCKYGFHKDIFNPEILDVLRTAAANMPRLCLSKTQNKDSASLII